jgi:hypothetical protein
MTMANELFFLQRIRRALESEQPHQRLVQVFERIEQDGAATRDTAGRMQYRLWLGEVARELQRLEADPAFADSGVDQADYPFAVTLYRDDQALATQTLTPGEAVTFKNLMPGDYRLQLDNGRLLWRRQLARQHLVWSAAFPGRPLKLAAASPDAANQTPDTRRDVMFEGDWQIRIQPGLERGRLIVEPAH